MKRGRSSLLLAILLFSFFLAARGSFVASAASPAFTFAAGGDHSQDINTNSSLHRLASSGVNLYLALGDMSYRSSGDEDVWCGIVKSYVGASFPFVLVSGFHEDGVEASIDNGGLIDDFVNCLPDRLGSTGVYGKEFYFDYPSSNPLARIIMISPELNFTNGGYYSYDVGSSHYEWLSRTIDAARVSGIPWVIVGMAKACISAGKYPTCPAGTDVMNLMIQKKVDLVLQAHDHNYQRSKQLTCAMVEQFVGSCVENDGLSGTYSKGAGTTFVISGTFGEEFYPINSTNPNALYFASLAGKNTSGLGHGFLEVTVTPNEIQAHTDFSGTFSDSFRIVTGGALRAAGNVIFVLLFLVPIMAWVTAFSIKRWKRRLLFTGD